MPLAMTWSKTDTRTFVRDTAGKKVMSDWLFLTFLQTKGWTCLWTEVSGDDKYFAMQRSLTKQDGSTMPINLVYEIEHASDDILCYSWDGVQEYADWSTTASTLLTDTAWIPFINEGDWDVWEDDASDGFMILKDNRPFAFQFPDGGWLPQPLNSGASAGTRPLRSVLPVQESGFYNSLNNAVAEAVSNCISPLDNSEWDLSVWQDYTAMGITTSSRTAPTYRIWEDVTNTWKMRAEHWWTGFGTIEVVKIDSEYYLNTGNFLLPAGTVEPTL